MISLSNKILLISFIFQSQFELRRIHGETLYCSLHILIDHPLWRLVKFIVDDRWSPNNEFLCSVQMFTTRANENHFRTNTLLMSYIYRNLDGLNELYASYRFPYGIQSSNISIQFILHGVTSESTIEFLFSIEQKKPIEFIDDLLETATVFFSFRIVQSSHKTIVTRNRRVIRLDERFSSRSVTRIFVVMFYWVWLLNSPIMISERVKLKALVFIMDLPQDD